MTTIYQVEGGVSGFHSPMRRIRVGRWILIASLGFPTGAFFAPPPISARKSPLGPNRGARRPIEVCKLDVLQTVPGMRSRETGRGKGHLRYRSDND